jgi:NTE family protein
MAISQLKMSSIRKILSLFFLILAVAGCATVKTRHDKSTEPSITESVKSDAEQKPLQQNSTESAVPEVVSMPPVLAPRPSVRIGLIFSGGGAKAWAHIGVLKEIQKAKWPIQAVGGVEWGAVVAAVYAQSQSVNEVEWELSKVRDLSSVESNSRLIFEKKSVADLRIPFVCASLNIAKQTNYLLNRGQLAWLMPFCLAHPPLTEPYGQSVAALTEISAMAQHLRQTGANRIVVINVLGQSAKRPFGAELLSPENILWSQSAALLAKKIPGVDATILIELDSYALEDLASRREMIAKGAQLGYNQILKLSQQYGL